MSHTPYKKNVRSDSNENGVAASETDLIDFFFFTGSEILLTCDYAQF